MRVFLLGATGTIGRAVLRALCARGHQVVCFARPGADARLALPDGAQWRFGRVDQAASLAADGVRGERFEAWVSCLASRTGEPADAWAIDHQAHRLALQVLGEAGVARVVLLSALCVQKPRLAFQQAKLAFERELIDSGLAYSIVRPTAFFKSLSGQVERVRQGRAYLVFGDGRLTACKPIADADLAEYLVDCLHRPDRQRRILPIGGPGPAITPRDQGEQLFRLLGRPARFRSVPVALLDGAVALLGGAARLRPAWSARAELARIGRYYATESMLVLNPQTGAYDAEATPSTGQTRLVDHYAQLLGGQARHERGEHAVF